MTNPYQSFDTEAYHNIGGEYQSPRGIVPSGMVQQVRVVAILNAVQGGLEIMMGGMLIAAGVMMSTMMMDDPNFRQQMNQQPNPPDEAFLSYMWIGYGVVGAILLAAGIFRVVAGIRNWSFRGRTMAIVSFCAGLLSVFSCYCAPTGIAVLIYGLIVYMNPSVAQAFEMGNQGLPGDRILYEFSPYRQNEP